MTKINEIVEVVARYVGIKPSDIYGNKRDNLISIARQVSIYLVNEFLPHLGLKEVAYVFNRTHATILYSIRQIDNKLHSLNKADKRIIKMVEELRKILQEKEEKKELIAKKKYLVILGPINDNPDWIIDFNNLRTIYSHIYNNYIIITPIETDEIAYEIYGNNCGMNEFEAVFMKYLCLADIVVCAKGYNNGGMSQLEHDVAVKLNKKIIYDEHRMEQL